MYCRLLSTYGTIWSLIAAYNRLGTAEKGRLTDPFAGHSIGRAFQIKGLAYAARWVSRG
ncbi:hypothetical protein [Paenibacillus sp. HJGM_3]|uniref:hypothetical protein n=1 Tax=Paenibacillus sp. HJGM_3 TaxID=3379816 RepID=UPI00385B9E0E